MLHRGQSEGRDAAAGWEDRGAVEVRAVETVESEIATLSYSNMSLRRFTNLSPSKLSLVTVVTFKGISLLISDSLFSAVSVTSSTCESGLKF